MLSGLSKFRIKAAVIHLAATALVGLIAAGLVFGLWYPWPYRVISGGIDLFMLVIGVDLVLGPLITLTIFSPKKLRNELVRDMTVVVLLQFSALTYGLYTVYEARPVVLALEQTRFRVVPAINVQLDELDQAPPELRHLSLTGPRVVNTAQPTEEKQRQEALLMAMAGADLGTRPSYWRAWNDAARHLTKTHGKSMQALLQRPCATGYETRTAVKRTQLPIESLHYLPLLARQANWIVLIDARTGEPIGFAPTQCVD